MGRDGGRDAAGAVEGVGEAGDAVSRDLGDGGGGWDGGGMGAGVCGVVEGDGGLGMGEDEWLSLRPSVRGEDREMQRDCLVMGF